MPRQSTFHIFYRSRETGRKRKVRIRAWSEEEARTQVTKEVTEIFSVVREPDEPATERQLAYAEALGIDVPEGSTLREVSDMICFVNDNDEPPSVSLQGFAEKWKVEFTNYTGKKSLFHRIGSKLREEGHELDLVAWFTYRVYRGLFHGRQGAPIQSPYHPLIQSIANELVKDGSIFRSIKYQGGRNLIRFGEWTSPDGYVHQGGSKRTIAYKCVVKALREKLGSQLRTKPQFIRPLHEEASPEQIKQKRREKISQRELQEAGSPNYKALQTGCLVLVRGIVGVFIVLTIIGWIAEQLGWITERPSPKPKSITTQKPGNIPESKNTIDLNGLTYTVMRVSHTSHIGPWKAETGEFYVVVDLKVKNPNPVAVTHDAEFQILDSEGAIRDRDPRITTYAKNGFFFEFTIKPKSSKPITLVFKVPEESLNQTWTLQIQNKNDKTSPGMIEVGSADKTLAQVTARRREASLLILQPDQGRQPNHSFPALGSSARI